MKTTNNKTAETNSNAVVAETMNTETKAVVEKVTKASICRRLFEEGLSRKQIADKLGIRYQQVYQYTSFMENAHHNAESTGRAIIVRNDEGVEMTRKEFVISELRKGKTRGEVAKQLNMPYQVVYGYLKKEGLLELGVRKDEETKTVVDEPSTK